MYLYKLRAHTHTHILVFTFIGFNGSTVLSLRPQLVCSYQYHISRPQSETLTSPAHFLAHPSMVTSFYKPL